MSMRFGHPEIRFIDVSIDFEVHGIVQGMYFTKYCQEECLKLGLCGWVKNSTRGTIIGKLQGPKYKVQKMVSWLSKNGCPGSQVYNCCLYNYRYIKKPEYRGFTLRF